ncbi:hypothetical protein ACJZ2D_003386 [Fusarium nematophilum]
MSQARITTTDLPPEPEPPKYFEKASNILSSLASFMDHIQRFAIAAFTFSQSVARPSADTSPSPAVSPATATLQPQGRNDPFRGPVQIPGCSPTTYVYPHSSAAIDPAFEERYREVVNIFRYNSKEHPGLRDNLQYIDYALKLCGDSPKASCPSIIVFCRHSEFKDLRSLLASKEMKYQYCLRRQTRKLPWGGSHASRSDDDDRPLFNLYFWRQHRPRTLYWGQQSIRIHSQWNNPLHSHPHMMPELTMCGSIVEGFATESAFATIGCVINIDSEYYAITAMHAFQSQSRPDIYGRGTCDCPSVENSSTGGSAGEATKKATEFSPYNEATPNGSYTRLLDVMPEELGHSIDDFEYESLIDDDDDEVSESTNNRSTSLSDSRGNQGETNVQLTESKEILMIFPSTPERDEGELDLDWALIKLTDPRDWRPNAFYYPRISSKLIFLSEVARRQPACEKPVVIITAGIPLRGMLQPGTSMLGGVNGRIPSRMWTVMLSEQNSLKKGDSGSIVVDAENDRIYGHVVGSNPIGEVYISPYGAIIDQIQHRFPRSSVALPKPLETLASLIDFHTASARDDTSTGLVRRLQKTHSKAAAHRLWQKDAVWSLGQVKSLIHVALVSNGPSPERNNHPLISPRFSA